MYDLTAQFTQTIAAQENLKPRYVLPFAGSSDPLHRVVLAYTSASKPYVVADPGYEAGFRAADFAGAKSIRIPLTKTYAHDVRAMAAADPNAGVIYVCNPNNPTGTLTPRADIEWLIENKPKGSVVLLDEAYIHFSSATPCSDRWRPIKTSSSCARSRRFTGWLDCARAPHSDAPTYWSASQVMQRARFRRPAWPELPRVWNRRPWFLSARPI